MTKKVEDVSNEILHHVSWSYSVRVYVLGCYQVQVLILFNSLACVMMCGVILQSFILVAFHHSFMNSLKQCLFA